MRIAALWTEVPGYTNTCFRNLAGRENVELFVSRRPPKAINPFDESQFEWLRNQFVWRSFEEMDSLDAELEAFNPDVIVFVGWATPVHRRIGKKWKGRAARVITMDNYWLGTLKQRLGVIAAPWYLRPIADAVWVPGKRQEDFARRLGFPKDNILNGHYSCDYEAFSQIYEERKREEMQVQRKFIFVGRMVEEKGIRMLASAYKKYKNLTASPWPLVCFGSGPLRSLLEEIDGVMVKGFVQPEALVREFAQGGCLVLPSSFEPWAVVIHEAASAGLLILASRAVGATAHLVDVGRNGFTFDVGDMEQLVGLMQRVSELDDAELDAMSEVSHELAQQFTPSRWSQTLLDFAEKWRVARWAESQPHSMH